MKTKKTILITAALLLLNILMLKAQDTLGIHFERSLTWKEILAKAKAEHKDIFVDCYATWCAPCKWMDANVYNQKAVGDAYNANFISVRIQMDKTSQDDSITKSRYDRAEILAKNYHVNAYPTFLFFDPDGHPVHKVSGSLEASQFIQLADDARNPAKQYYALLKNFQPGQIDTAEEKNLPLVFQNSDHQLAGKIAADYLSRIPKSRLNTYDSGRLMSFFQDDPQVMDITAGYLRSMSTNEFLRNKEFMLSMIEQPKVKAIVIQYIQSLSFKEICQKHYMHFIEYFRLIPQVQAVAQNYINHLPDKKIFDDENLIFIVYFMDDTNGRAFELFYRKPALIDTLEKSKGFAEGAVQRAIYNSEIVPALYASQKSGETPDFEALKTTITKKYNTEYANKIIPDAKVAWYGYLVHDKRDDRYWPDYIKAEIDCLKPSLTDSAGFKAHFFDVNNLCFNDIFHHSNEAATLNLAVNWMQKVVETIPPSDYNGTTGTLDTYACVLYKAGKKDEAIKTEQKALDIASATASKGDINEYTAKISAMQKGGPVWEDKLFH